MNHGAGFGAIGQGPGGEARGCGEESSDKLLSICIPTYNRAECLRALLDTLAEAMPPGERRIEILISDNAGTDDTAAIVDGFRARLPTMEYWRNDSNIGAERNMLKLAAASRGRYLWLFGDDDLICRNALANLMTEMTSDVDYFVLNFSTVNQSGDVCISPRAYRYAGDRDLLDPSEVLSLFGLRLGLISGVIARRDELLKVPADDFLRLAACGLSFFYSVLVVCGNDTKGRYLANPIFRYRACNSDHATTPEKWTDVYGRSLREITADLARGGYSAAALRRLHTGMMTDYYLFCILGARLRGQPTRAYYRSLLAHYSDTPAAWLVMATILIPGWAARLARWLWRSRHRLRKSTGPARKLVPTADSGP